MGGPEKGPMHWHLGLSKCGIESWRYFSDAEIEGACKITSKTGLEA
jgi:hypothetical protein